MPKRGVGALAPESRKHLKRIQGLPPSTSTAEDSKSGIDVKLPTEVKIAVLELLEKSDLKQARLVSSSWYPLATRLLFDRVYISPKSLDIEVFMECVRHPIIKESIKEIIYDVTYFDLDLTSQQYVMMLVNELFAIYLREPIQNPTLSFHHFIVHAVSDECDYSELYEEHKNETFIVEGYQVWQEHAWDGYWNMEKGLFVNSLCRGLHCFNNLRSIVVKDGLFGTNLSETGSMDRSTLRCKYSGSPVLRNWNPLHARPSDNTPENVDNHFRKLTSALANSDREIKSLRLFNGQHEYSSLPLSTLQSAVSGSTLLHNSVQACYNLETFTFRLDSSIIEEDGKEDALGMLPSLLGEMRQLKKLDLCLGRASPGIPEHWTYKQVFPSRCYVWPKMVSLAISGLSIRAIDFLDLLFVRAPAICKLQLFFIDLLSGTWEGVIDALSESRKLEELRMPCLHKLTHKGGCAFHYGTKGTDYTPGAFEDDITDYILQGGRHPCLPQHCEPVESKGYVWGMILEEDLGNWLKWYKGMGMMPPPDLGSIVPSTLNIDT